MIAFSLSEVDFNLGIEETTSRIDDLEWSWRVLVQPFTWQGFLNWWAARRWVLPRDVRKR